MPLTTNILDVRAFVRNDRNNFEVFLWAFLIKQLFHLRLLDMG